MLLVLWSCAAMCVCVCVQLLTSLIINGVNDNLVNPEKLVIDLMPQEVGHGTGRQQQQHGRIGKQAGAE